MDDRIAGLKTEIAQFVAERDWGRFHTPKNLAISVVIESAELAEIFQWKESTPDAVLDQSERSHLAEEIGDVMIYLCELAGAFGLDPVQCATEKLRTNGVKYPAEQVRGDARKHDQYR